VADLPPYPGTPRWVKVFGIIMTIVVLLFVVAIIFGSGHGPGRHTRSGGSGGRTTLASAIDKHTPAEGGQG